MTVIASQMTKVRIIAKPSKMGDKIIIIIPRDYHKDFKPLIGKRCFIDAEEAL